jgi:hypothetical protein
MGDLVTHLYSDPTEGQPPGRRHRSVSFRLNGVVSPVLPLETGRWGRCGVRTMAGRSLERHGWQWWWVDRDGCLDPAAIGPYGGGSKPRREEKTVRKQKPRTGLATGTSVVEEHHRARVRVQP